MTAEEAVKRLTAKVECMERENSGTDLDCDECELCYAQGTLGEQIEALKVAIEALEKQIPKKYVRDGITNKCPSCDLTYMFVRSIHGDGSYCTKCGQKIDMRGET